jgi:hypothetical protein
MSDPSANKENSVSRLEAALQRRADRLGKSLEQLLADDRVARRQSSYPGPQCLNPYEVEHFFSAEDLPEDRIAHVETCAMCASLLDAARPTENALASFIEEFRQTQPPAVSVRPFANVSENLVRRPLMEVLGIEVLFLIAVAAAGIFVGVAGDDVLKSVLSSIAVRSLLIVAAFGVLIPLLVVAAVKLVTFAQGGSFQRFGGWAVGGLATALLGCYLANVMIHASSTYSSLESAQRALLTSVAEQQMSGVRPGVFFQSTALKVSGTQDGTLTATSAKFEGTVFTQAQTDGIDVYWSNGRRHNLGTIYKGTVQHEPDGDAKVLTAADTKIEIGPNDIGQTLGSGTRVLALVPTNSSQASMVVVDALKDATVLGKSKGGTDKVGQ